MRRGTGAGRFETNRTPARTERRRRPLIARRCGTVPKCAVCGAVHRSRRRLRRHYDEQHSGEVAVPEDERGEPETEKAELRDLEETDDE
jgi:hypothetical protein